MKKKEPQSEMTYQDFWSEIIAECQADLDGTSEYPQTIFYEKFEDILVDNNVITPMNSWYYESRNASKKYHLMRIDYGKIDTYDNSINLLIVDYDPRQITTITNDKRDDMYKKMVDFVINITKGYFEENELHSDSIYPFVSEVAKALPNTDKINCFILSSNVKSSVLKDVKDKTMKIGERELVVSLSIIDIKYLYNCNRSTRAVEPINIRVSDINEGRETGIRCLPADVSGGDYKAYLAVLSGTFLSEIYRLYGGRLLEKNVRSFLSTRGNVNKGIRNTIRTEPSKFFTYNNGIACTAASIKIEKRDDGFYITEFYDLQIINGGQTTASLRNAVLTDKDGIVDLKKVFIPMKLTVIDESVSDEERDILVNNISKYSNSQNKVSNSDLNSNSPFYVQLEKLSRKTFTPIINGSQTQWYFERARGQYERDQMELSQAKRKNFKAVNPRNQLLRVIDIAKYYNSVIEKPFRVSWGGQVNAEDFQKTMQGLYEKDSSFVNLQFFKTIVAYAILFLKAKDIIRRTYAYQNHKGILAEVVTYTISMLMHLIRTEKKDLDWNSIWNQQDLPFKLKEEIERLGVWVIDVLTDPNRGKDNVGEWAKLKECWEGMCKRGYKLSGDTLEILVSREEIKAQEEAAKKSEKFSRSVDIGLLVYKLGSSYWRDVLDAGQKYKKFANDLQGYKSVQKAIQTCDKNSLIQRKSELDDLMRIKREFEEEGIIYRKEVDEYGE